MIIKIAAVIILVIFTIGLVIGCIAVAGLIHYGFKEVRDRIR